eukprot:TRINITY_DN49924_c0_g1_i1.p1 TRINITY_DN49924_c0_g1~~TRINITY_DN49924_c0_g1_i1.p1  ORF type:complete len:387 (-),score=57.59 TRINITY_DN49924_c0_g1_i1:54-1115(-)
MLRGPTYTNRRDSLPACLSPTSSRSSDERRRSIHGACLMSTPAVPPAVAVGFSPSAVAEQNAPPRPRTMPTVTRSVSDLRLSTRRNGRWTFWGGVPMIQAEGLDPKSGVSSGSSSPQMSNAAATLAAAASAAHAEANSMKLRSASRRLAGRAATVTNLGSTSSRDHTTTSTASSTRPPRIPATCLFRMSDWKRDEVSVESLGDALQQLRARQTQERPPTAPRRARRSMSATVASASRTSEEEHEVDMREALLREAFFRYDKDGNGYIDRGELANVLEDLGMHIGNATSDPESLHRQGLADRVFAMADTNGDGRLSFEEFSEYKERLTAMLEFTKGSNLVQNFKRIARQTDDEI